ncbi:MAG: peptidylprolyl isomerase, partial [Nitrospinota bacterium]|nr:peptidylprolyl isomerase [Nitrospinota bacterium]
DKEVIRELMYQAAKTTGIQLDSELMEKEMVKLMKVMGGEEKYYSSLKKRNIDPAIIRHDMEMQFLIHDLIKEQIEGKIDITDAEVKMLYDTNIDKFKRPKSFHTRHILIPHFSRKDLNDVGKDDMGEKQRELSEQSMKKAQKILAELQGGADFEALAKEYSKDEESANKGGDLSFIYKGIFPPEFDDAVEKLKPQEISDVVTTVAGHHIIQLIETRPPGTAPFKDVEQGIQQFLFMQNGKKRLEQYVEKLRQRANVEVLY